MNQDHYKKLENMYLSANINTHLFTTTKAKIYDKGAEISLDIEEKYFHALGAIHGSVYFKLLDDAAFFAVNSVVPDVFVLTTSFNIHMIRPASSGKITATGKIKFQSRELWVAESTLVNETGKQIGFGTGNFARSKVQLTEEIGYR